MSTTHRAAWFASAAGLVILASLPAEAGGFALREQSANGQGSSFAGVAAGGSLSSMYWNPATLADQMGWSIEGVVTGVLPYSDVDVTAPFASGEGDIANDAVLPATYSAYRFNDRLVLGLGVNSGFGLVTEYDRASPLRTFGIAGESSVFSLNVNPALSYQVNDWLSVGVGAQLQYMHVELTDLNFGPLGVSRVTGDDIGIGFTAGVTLTPAAGTEIGIGYRSFIDHTVEGELATPVLGDFDITGEGLNLPDIVTIGLRQSITDRVRVLAGAEWSNWSRFQAIDLSGGPAPIALPFDYEDGFFVSAGGEFDATDRLTLRGGIGYEWAPIDDANRTFRLPDGDRLWLSAGASFTPNQRWSFDAAYTYIHSGELDFTAAAGGGPVANGPFSGTSDSHVSLISVAAKVKLGALAPAK